MPDLVGIRAILTIVAILGHIVTFYGLYSRQKHEAINCSIVGIGMAMLLIPMGICASIPKVLSVIVIIIGVLTFIFGIVSLMVYNTIVKREMEEMKERANR